jgi:hypothetical protein
MILSRIANDRTIRAGPRAQEAGLRTRLVLAAACLLVLAQALHAKILFTDVTKDTRIAFRHTDGSSGRRYLVETVTAGLALFDYDSDGDVDIYFLNGAPLPGMRAKTPPTNALYRNDGHWKFTDVTKPSGLGDTGYGLAVAVGDYDNDGDPDVYVVNYGPNVLYRNNGDGTFTDVTREAGVAGGGQAGAGACFFDMDGDGDLDLYVANYLKFSYETHVTTMADGYSTYVNPRHYPPLPAALYRNNGNGTFTEVSEASGIGRHAGYGMGVICADYDDDGDTDIVVGNDVFQNFLFRNDGRGHFEDVALAAGFAYKGNGDASASMGVDCGDYDNDGHLDFYLTSYQDDLAVLYRNLGDGTFQDVTGRTGAGAGTWSKVTWGNTLADFDNDGDRDIFVASGHLQDNVDRYDDVTSYYERNILLENMGHGKFVDVSDTSGTGLQVKLSSRGAGFDDLDNDGDIDVVILNARREPTVLRNDSPAPGHWLQVLLRGTATNRDGVGARVKVTAGELLLVDEVHSGRGYQSHYGTRLYFGLGHRAGVDRIEVRWLGGGVDAFDNIPVDRLITLTEGSSKGGPQ